jgi:hypothetical protein
VQKHRCFEEKIQFVEATIRRIGPRYILYPGEDILNGTLRHNGPEDDLVGILDAKADDVAVFQYAAVDRFFVHMEAAAMASVLKMPPIAL